MTNLGHPPRRRPATPRSPAAPAVPARFPWLEPVLSVAGLAVVVLHVARLWLQAAGGVFATDECFHAYVAEWLLAHRALPVEFPELYSGLYYDYPPLFHVVGAAWSASLGAPALHVLPVALHAALLALLAGGALGAVPRRAGLWAALLVTLQLTMIAFAVRLYVDVLTSLLFVLGAAVVLRLGSRARRRDALALGVVLGLTLLTKLTGFFLLAIVLVLAIGQAVRGDRGRALAYAGAAALGVALALPWYLRTWRLFGSPLYPLGAPDLDRWLYALNRAKFSTPTGDFLAGLAPAIGPWLGAFVVAALAWSAMRRRLGLRAGLVLGMLACAVLAAFVPLAAARHLAPFLAVMALASAAVVFDWARRRRATLLAIEFALVALAAHATWTLPEWRRPADLPADLREAFPAVAARTAPSARILSLWTYDTFYYTRRAATWPNLWGREHLVAPFRDVDADSLLAHLRGSRITDLLLPTTRGAPEFDSANYPEAFLLGVGALCRRGDAKLVWTSPRLALVHLVPADSARAASRMAVAPAR